MRPEAPEVGHEDAAARLRPLLATARELGAHLHVDMESVDSLETTEALIFDLLDEDDSATGRRRAWCCRPTCATRPTQLERVLDWAGRSGRTPPLTIRLVKGAYWDHEVVEARQHGWGPPVFESKADCDRNFEELTRAAARRAPARPRGGRVAQPALGLARHRLQPRRRRATTPTWSCRCCAAWATSWRTRSRRAGMRVRSYCPVGDLVAGMAYLVRRLLENTANESFLHDWRQGAELDELLAAP